MNTHKEAFGGTASCVVSTPSLSLLSPSFADKVLSCLSMLETSVIYDLKVEKYRRTDVITLMKVLFTQLLKFSSWSGGDCPPPPTPTKYPPLCSLVTISLCGKLTNTYYTKKFD